MTDRAALAYLTASGAAAICILDDGAIKAGAKLDRHAALIFQLPESAAIPVSRQARREAGAHPDTDTMTAALREAAAGHGVTLTEHEIAVARAKDATQRINAFVDSMRKTGSLQVFNRHYKAARAAALARGESFMSYTAALGRLRSQIAARLAAGATCTLRG